MNPAKILVKRPSGYLPVALARNLEDIERLAKWSFTTGNSIFVKMEECICLIVVKVIYNDFFFDAQIQAILNRGETEEFTAYACTQNKEPVGFRYEDIIMAKPLLVRS